MAKKFYLTTAIAYASKKPHVGNDYEIIFTDCLARYHRMLGEEVFLLTGTDEHGQKIQELAQEAGISPKEYVDKVAGAIQENYKNLNISNDGFIRTTDLRHEQVVKKIFKRFYDQGDIYKSEYEGMYCVPCESFFTENQLVDGRCPDCGREVKKAKEESYFFKMSNYQQRLMEYIQCHPDFIQPKRREREMVNNFLKPGLQDLCVSRTSFSWGIGVDFDPKHVIYVWIDALSNYITAIGYDPDGSSEQFEKLWPCDVHVIGKDILRFHTIYWPIMLMALGLPLPKKVFGHPWLLFGTEKMSKSKGNVMYSDQLAQQFGVDGVRYYVLSEMPYAQDGSITYDQLVAKFNSDLANTYGNLVNRTVAMTQKYFGGKVFAPGSLEPVDQELRACAAETVSKYKTLMDDYHVADAMDAVLALARRSNKYIDETTPWVLAKTPEGKERLKTVLYHLLESIRFIAVLLQPAMPGTSEAIAKQLGCRLGALDTLDHFGGIQPDSQVGQPEVLFARIDEKAFFARLNGEEDKTEQPAKAQKTSKSKEGKKAENASLPEGMISIEQFAQVELRCALITGCEPVPKSDKLLKLQLDDGAGGRQVVSGIHPWYEPVDLIGKKIVVVANLAPAKLRGVESQGMILAADMGDAAKVLFLDDSVPAGAKIR